MRKLTILAALSTLPACAHLPPEEAGRYVEGAVRLLDHACAYPNLPEKARKACEAQEAARKGACPVAPEAPEG